jgi:hypothetical protein
MLYNEQWDQETIDRMIPDLSERLHLVTMVVHARDYLRSSSGVYADRMNAIGILGDGLKNMLERGATGLEWWTLRHRLTGKELQSNDWLDKYKTSWITAREAEDKRNNKQR